MLENSMTVICCVKNINSLPSNTNCTIIIKGEINGTHQFREDGCAVITIPGTLYGNLSYEAYIDGDIDFCYRTHGILTYNGN